MLNFLMRRAGGVLAKKANPTQTVDGFSKLIDAYKENEQVREREITNRAEIEKERQCQIQEIKAKQNLLLKYMEHSFSERKENFSELFSQLDKAIESNNVQAMQVTAGMIVDIAKSSPMKTLKDFRDDSVKKIEF